LRAIDPALPEIEQDGAVAIDELPCLFGNSRRDVISSYPVVMNSITVATPSPHPCPISPSLSHPLVQVAGGQHLFRVFPIESAIVRDISHVSQFHRRTLLLDALREVLDGLTILEDGIDPLILEAMQAISRTRVNSCSPG
jgi:hypothetical protein